MEFYIFSIQKLRKKLSLVFRISFFLLANFGCGNDCVTCHILLYLMNGYVIIIRNMETYVSRLLFLFTSIHKWRLKASTDSMNIRHTLPLHSISRNRSIVLHNVNIISFNGYLLGHTRLDIMFINIFTITFRSSFEFQLLS